eukprot:1477550-Rhodomonas_salina.2
MRCAKCTEALGVWAWFRKADSRQQMLAWREELSTASLSSRLAAASLACACTASASDGAASDRARKLAAGYQSPPTGCILAPCQLLL